MLKKVGIFLLSYRRPEFVVEAIDSILSQDYVNFELIISENSPDDLVMSKLKKLKEDNRLIIIKRRPSLSSLDHFNRILEESAKYEYVMLFHDDDVLKPNALDLLLKAIEKHPSATAVASNAQIIKDRKHTAILLSPNIIKDIEVLNPSQLIDRYIFKSLGHPPFPAYLYRAAFLKGLTLQASHGGKYSDVSFLIKLIQRGTFIWLAQPLMEYRQHSQNDSVNLDLKDIFSLCRFFLSTSPKSIFKIIFYYLKQVAKRISLKM